MQEYRKTEHKLIKLQTVDSTHLLALRLLDANAITEDVTITAKTQTSGIGRCGRVWNSKNNNLFMSEIKKIPNGNSSLSLIVACALYEVLSEILSSDDGRLTIHWPNDIHYDDKKLSGILISSINDWFVISIGVNIFSIPELSTAISLREIHSGFNMDVIKLLHKIEDSIDKWLMVDFSYVKDYWIKHAKNIGQSITIKNGTDSLSGIFNGIDDTGRLMLAIEGKVIYISSGDLFENMDKIMVKMV